MARQSSGLAAITDYIRRNPRTAAIAAFNLGLYAASLTRKGVRRSDLKDLPSKLAELVPGMRDLVEPCSDDDGRGRAAAARSANRARASRFAVHKA